MKYMLDTNICIYLINHRDAALEQKFRQYDIGDICISSITYAELCYGISKSQHPVESAKALAVFLSNIEITPFDGRASIAYGRIRADLERSGTPIGALDNLIAAHAYALGRILVTNNTREFARVRGLHLENWVAPTTSI